MPTFTMHRIYSAFIDQGNAISAAADKDVTRTDMAQFYADCIRADQIGRASGGDRVEWKAVNDAITARWPKGLTFIKRLAWKNFNP